jgi:hypothetical protein
MAENRIKRWAMLQMWRLQQVAQILTLIMLAITLSLQVWGFVKWRGDFMGSYAGVLVIFFILAALVWSIAFIWDVRLRMWREQISVLMQKNPFVKERMTSKEIAIYAMTWIPVLEHMGKDNPALRAQADRFRDWLKREVDENVITKEELEDILKHIGSDRKDLFGLEGK